MLFLARKNLFQEKTRLFISVGGVAFSVLLMVLLQGLNIGFSNVIGQYFEKIPADFWVAKASTGNIMDPSFLPLKDGDKLKKIDGVVEVKPYDMQSLTTDVNGKDLQFYLITYDANSSFSSPAKVSEGIAVPGQGEIVVDSIMAKSNHVKIGDNLEFAGHSLKVVGLSEGTYLLASSFAFVNQQDAKTYALPGDTNYFVVSIKPTANPRAVASAISDTIPDVKVHTKDHFIKVNVDVVKDIVKPVFGALVVLGALIGLAVIGLTIFTSTIEKAKEYGILKAIGFKNRQLYMVVIEQAITATVIGFIIGAILAFALNPLIAKTVPQFVAKIRIIDIIWIFVVAMVIAVIASYIPIRRLSKIDPAETFRA